jgi:hypothetical protein
VVPEAIPVPVVEAVDNDLDHPNDYLLGDGSSPF